MKKSNICFSLSNNLWNYSWPKNTKISHKFRNSNTAEFRTEKRRRGYIHPTVKAFIHYMRKRTDGRTDGHSKYPRGYGVCGLTCWKNKGSKARRKKVAVWKRAQFLPHKVGTKLVFFSKSGGGGFLETSQVHAAECQSLWYCGVGRNFNLRSLVGVIATFAVQTFCISWEE